MPSSPDQRRFRSWLARDILAFRRLRAQFGFPAVKLTGRIADGGVLEARDGTLYVPFEQGGETPVFAWEVLVCVTSGGSRMDPPDVDETTIVKAAYALLIAHEMAASAMRLHAISDALVGDGLAGADQEEDWCDFDMAEPAGSLCPHGNAGECDACDRAGDQAYDAAREMRSFGRR